MKELKEYALVIVPLAIIICVIVMIYYYQTRTSGIAKDLQEIVEEIAGDGYEVVYPHNEEVEIGGVRVEVSWKRYQQTNFYSTSEKLKVAFLEYVRQNEKSFKIHAKESREKFGISFMRQESEREKLMGYLGVNKECDEFSSISIMDEHAIHNISEITELVGVKKLHCKGIMLDNTEVFERFQGLEKLVWITAKEDEIQRLEKINQNYSFDVIVQRGQYGEVVELDKT